MSLGTNGIMTLNSLSGIGNRILLTDANGNITALPSGGSGQFLLSDGTWSSLPLSATVWQLTGNDLSFVGGNLGIGTSSPAYKLEVAGDARISNNLYVGGGIVVTDKLDASIEVKAGDVKVNNDLKVNGNSKFLGTVTAEKGFMVDNTTGFSFTPGTTSGTGTFQLGKIQPINVACAAQPNSGLNFDIGANLQIYDPANPTTAGLLNLQTWTIGNTTGCSIDASTGGNLNNSGLLINYWCGNKTVINTGPNGGDVYVGGYGTAYLTKTIVRSSNPSTVAFEVVDPSDSKVNFRVKNNGFVYAREINVMASTVAFPDYVFEKSYKLLTISELDSYIKTNKHLPGFKKGEEYDKEGLNVSELIIKQQEKIEELALYIIELEKRMSKVETKK